MSFETLRNSSTMLRRNFSISKDIDAGGITRKQVSKWDTVKRVYQWHYDLEYANDFYFLSDIKYDPEMGITTVLLASRWTNSIYKFSKIKPTSLVLRHFIKRRKERRKSNVRKR